MALGQTKISHASWASFVKNHSQKLNTEHVSAQQTMLVAQFGCVIDFSSLFYAFTNAEYHRHYWKSPHY